MNRKNSRRIAETITNEQIKQMFDNAKANITDWTKVSNINKGLTKGSAWNILTKNFDVSIKYHILGKINMVHEFGEYLPNELKPQKQMQKKQNPPVHHNPIFN